MKLEVFLDQHQISQAVERLAGEIQRDYEGMDLLMLGVLKGSFIFMADLVRHLRLPLEMDFVRLSSYGDATESSGRVSMTQGPSGEVKGRPVLIVEDIVDSGLTVDFLMKHLARQGPASVRICALLDKPSRRQVPLSIHYLGFQIPDLFVVGYGLDYGEKYRHLPDICVLKQE
ncbi:MAG: hypoxanthine phosphoribosyltransferase [Chloroflexi bacterium]|nr:hypoxanthine phosphoribosyltransferase [Chloroflexota bacterium]